MCILNGTLERHVSEIEALEGQLEENGLVIATYEEDYSNKQTMLEQVKRSICIFSPISIE